MLYEHSGQCPWNRGQDEMERDPEDWDRKDWGPSEEGRPAERGGVMEDFLTVEQLAERFGVAPVTARHWCLRGLFPNAVQVAKTGRGSVWLVPVADTEGFKKPRVGYPRGRPRGPVEEEGGQEVTDGG
jgi:hypothetical protein